MEAYCMRCKQKVTIKNPKKTKTKKGTPMTRGVCSTCGSNVCVIGK